MGTGFGDGLAFGLVIAASWAFWFFVGFICGSPPDKPAPRIECDE